MEEKNVCKQSVYENLYRSVAPLLFRFLLYKFQNTAYAEDTVQEAFFTLWKNCKKVTQELAKTYVYRVAQNLLIRRLQKDKAHQRYMGFQTKDKEEVGVDFYLEYKELSEKLQLAIGELPDGQRVVFMMNRFDKKTYVQIAQELDLSVKTIEKRMHQALVKLRTICKNI